MLQGGLPREAFLTNMFEGNIFQRSVIVLFDNIKVSIIYCKVHQLRKYVSPTKNLRLKSYLYYLYDDISVSYHSSITMSFFYCMSVSFRVSLNSNEIQ